MPRQRRQSDAQRRNAARNVMRQRRQQNDVQEINRNQTRLATQQLRNEEEAREVYNASQRQLLHRQRQDPEIRQQHNAHQREVVNMQRQNPEIRQLYNAHQREVVNRQRQDPEIRQQHNAHEREAARGRILQNEAAMNRIGCRAQSILLCEQKVHVHNVGERSVLCNKCSALRWPGETPSICCLNGKVQLDPVPEPPEVLNSFWQNETVRTKLFRKHSQQLNSCLALASQKVQEIFQAQGRGWNTSVVIQGKMYHRMGPLQAQNDQTLTFAQIYVHDPGMDRTEEALRLGKYCRLK